MLLKGKRWLLFILKHAYAKVEVGSKDMAEDWHFSFLLWKYMDIWAGANHSVPLKNYRSKLWNNKQRGAKWLGTQEIVQAGFLWRKSHDVALCKGKLIVWAFQIAVAGMLGPFLSNWRVFFRAGHEPLNGFMYTVGWKHRKDQKCCCLRYTIVSECRLSVLILHEAHGILFMSQKGSNWALSKLFTAG